MKKIEFWPRTQSDLQDHLLLNSIPVTECGCWIWLLSCHHAGHGQIMFNCTRHETHRASWQAFVGDIPDGKHVLHRCNIPCCINPDHLYIGSDLENCHDRIAAGTQAKPPIMLGEKHPNTRLTEENVRRILFGTDSAKELAGVYGVKTVTIYAIRAGRNWSHVTQ